MALLAFNATLSGRVQGVGFRHYCMWEGRRLGLTGWVRNLADGDVEVWAEGAESQLDDFLQWLRDGPSGARVDSLEYAMTSPSGAYEDFFVKR